MYLEHTSDLRSVYRFTEKSTEGTYCPEKLFENNTQKVSLD